MGRRQPARKSPFGDCEQCKHNFAAARLWLFCVPATPRYYLTPTRCRDNNYALWKSRYFLDLGLFQVSGRTGLCKSSSRSCGTAPHHVKLSRLSLLLAPDWLAGWLVVALPRKGGRFIDGPRGHHCDRHSIMSRCRCLSAHSHQRSWSSSSSATVYFSGTAGNWWARPEHIFVIYFRPKN